MRVHESGMQNEVTGMRFRVQGSGFRVWVCHLCVKVRPNLLHEVEVHLLKIPGLRFGVFGFWFRV